MSFSRRHFIAIAASGLVRPADEGRAAQASLTAQQVIDRIRAKLGVPWRDKTIDGFKAGDPATPVTGIMLTVSTTLPRLQRAATIKSNLVITQGPLFYSPNDDAGTRAADPVLRAKKAYIEEKHLVVWRLSEHWALAQPEAAVTALAERLQWATHRVPGGEPIYNIPPTTFAALLSHIRNRLGPLNGGLRTIGPADMPVRTVLLSPGATDLASTVARLPRADVIVTGEPREWEVVPYVLDMRTAGSNKGLIALGRILSDQPGVSACAAWIKSFVPEVPVEANGIDDPYWRPAL